jgi:transposase
MDSIALGAGDVIVGVDTHKDRHMAVAIDGLGVQLGGPVEVAASNDGYGQLMAWASGLGCIHGFGVEGCGSYGQGLARFLRRHGYLVREVARPPRKGERRLNGKSDAIDAEHAARTMLHGPGTAIPKAADGEIEALRLLKITPRHGRESPNHDHDHPQSGHRDRRP